MHFAPLILAFATVSATVSAQVGARGMMTGTPRTSSPHPAGVAAHRSVVGLAHPGFRHPNRFGSLYLGSPLWWDDGFDYGYSPVVIAQPDPRANTPQPSMHWEDAPKSQAPLLIELQGDRYVRFSESNSSPASTVESRSASNANDDLLARESSELPTLFIFRDGHQEESNNYSIVAGTIYASNDYWTNGAWSRKILIADLDVPATMQANQQRGVRFVLPSAPNEVVTRP